MELLCSMLNSSEAPLCPNDGDDKTIWRTQESLENPRDRGWQGRQGLNERSVCVCRRCCQ